jgi:hypothetical protein
VQIPLQVAILGRLSTLAKDGTLLSHATVLSGSTPTAGYTAAKVVNIGHSLGSYVANGLLGANASTTDAAVLTGWLAGPKIVAPLRGLFNLRYAAGAAPARFGSLPQPAGYMMIGSPSAYEYLFLAPGGFEPGALEYYFDRRQTFTAGEQHSAGAALAQAGPATEFTGPLLVTLGERDRAFCVTTTCEAVVDLDYLRTQYPNAKDVSVYLQPGTGHLLTSSFNATAGYQVIFDWLDSQGL